jgi:hypothetical protein
MMGSSERKPTDRQHCMERMKKTHRLNQACAEAHHLNGRWHPQEREHSDAEGGTRDRVQRRDRLGGYPEQEQ